MMYMTRGKIYGLLELSLTRPLLLVFAPGCSYALFNWLPMIVVKYRTAVAMCMSDKNNDHK